MATVPMIYETAGLYIRSKTTLAEKIVAIDQVIAALIDAQIAAAEQATVEEYLLNDGQVQIKSIYRNPKDISAAIDLYEKIRERYVNQVNGRVMQLKDWRNFTKRY